MEHEFLFDRAFTALRINLEEGESLKAEPDSMVSMNTHINVEGEMEGGFWQSLKRGLAGEDFFFLTLEAQSGPGEAILAPGSIGDLQCLELDGDTDWNVQKDGFFAGSQELDVSSEAQNLVKGLFSGEGLFIVKVSGAGKLFVSSFGAIYKIDVPEGKDYIVDNGHLVAWPETMEYEVEKASGGWFSSFKSGEGLVTRFQGPGSVYIQTRKAPSFVNWLMPHLPKRQES